MVGSMQDRPFCRFVSPVPQVAEHSENGAYTQAYTPASSLVWLLGSWRVRLHSGVLVLFVSKSTW